MKMQTVRISQCNRTKRPEKSDNERPTPLFHQQSAFLLSILLTSGLPSSMKHVFTNEAVSLAAATKTYTGPGGNFTALHPIDLTIPAGQMVAVVGKSGSGKSTLLNLITGIDHASAGLVTVGGSRLAELTEDRLAAWRGTSVGIVFQFFQLIPTLTVLENIVLPMELCGMHTREGRRIRATALLERVGVADQGEKFPAYLSGGQQQRVAIARSLANDAPLVVADEPTGNLDSRTSEEIFQLFRSLADSGKTVVIVTHEAGFRHFFDRVIVLADGRIVTEA